MAKVERVPIEDVPNMPSSGKWVWKDDSLEFISASGQDKNASKGRMAARQGTFVQDIKNLDRGFDFDFDFEMRTPSAGKRPYSKGVGVSYGRDLSAKGRKENRSEQASFVTLEMVKEVAISMLSKVQHISPQFERLFRAPELDEMLLAFLRYFSFFFEKRTQDNKPNPMNIEPSRRELAAYEGIVQKMTATQKVIGKAYCTLILGTGLTEHHHMNCGSSRVSATYTDRAMFETLYAFCTFVIWITFKRKEYDMIREEIGRIMRSQTFNPAIRVKNYNPKFDEDGQMLPEEKTSPAEYRRLHPRRPAIKTIVTQRSPAVVSILPSPKEDANWLFDRRKGHSNINFDITVQDEVETDSTSAAVKLGILGDNINLYNAQLAPKGADNEDEEAEEEEGMGFLALDRDDVSRRSETDGKDEAFSESDAPTRPPAASRATTAGLTERD